MIEIIPEYCIILFTLIHLHRTAIETIYVWWAENFRAGYLSKTQRRAYL